MRPSIPHLLLLLLLSLQVDALLSRLHILQERIGNTEHLVNLDLDAKRNALVAYTLGIDLILMVS